MTNEESNTGTGVLQRYRVNVIEWVIRSQSVVVEAVSEEDAEKQVEDNAVRGNYPEDGWDSRVEIEVCSGESELTTDEITPIVIPATE